MKALDIYYFSINDNGYIDNYMIRCFDESIENKTYLQELEQLINRKDVINITIFKID